MKEKAKAILEQYWDKNSTPIDPFRIAANMGIPVLADPAMKASGHYEPTGRSGGPLISFNPRESLVRQRFTVAHELAHHILQHGSRDRDTPKNFTLSDPDEAEVDANKLAAQLLLPEQEVRTLVEVRGISNILELAKIFQVSRAAMTYRLRELGYAAKY